MIVQKVGCDTLTTLDHTTWWWRRWRWWCWWGWWGVLWCLWSGSWSPHSKPGKNPSEHSGKHGITVYDMDDEIVKSTRQTKDMYESAKNTFLKNPVQNMTPRGSFQFLFYFVPKVNLTAAKLARRRHNRKFFVSYMKHILTEVIWMIYPLPRLSTRDSGVAERRTINLLSISSSWPACRGRFKWILVSKAINWLPLIYSQRPTLFLQRDPVNFCKAGDPVKLGITVIIHMKPSQTWNWFCDQWYLIADVTNL